MFIRSFLFRRGPTPGALFDHFGYSSLGPIAKPIIRAYLYWWESSRIRLIAWH